MTWKLAGSLVVYIASIIAANVATSQFGQVGVGFGLLVTAGTFAAGFALLARDLVHETGGLRWVAAGITVGAGLSWILATPQLAVASAVAFTVAELVDLGVFTQLRERGFIPAALTSNLVGAPVDTIIFLTIAGFPLTVGAVVGQLVGKWLWATVLPIAAYLTTRAIWRKTTT